MAQYIKIKVTDKMEEDAEKCSAMSDEGKDMNCETCSCNGGEGLGCLADMNWENEDEDGKR